MNERDIGVPAISRARCAGASALLAALAACGPPHPGAPGPATPEPKALPPRPLDQVFVLEAAGSQPGDTVIQLLPGTARVIVLRREAPDFGLFARVELGDSTLKSAGNGSPVALSLRPRPGEYGMELDSPAGLGKGGTILFSYGAHFVAPAGARQRYGSDIYFERALAIGRLESNGQVVFLPTLRPGSDMLSAPLDGPGRYLVAAPR